MLAPTSAISNSLASALPRSPCSATPGVGLGPVDAPAQLTVFIDPLTGSPGALSLWIELRRFSPEPQRLVGAERVAQHEMTFGGEWPDEERPDGGATITGNQPDLHVRVEPVSGGMVRDPANEALLRWFLAASDAGAQEAALWLIDRDGRDRLALRLARPGGAAALAAEIGKPGPLPVDPCSDRRIEAARRSLREHQQSAGSFAGRPPLFALGQRLVFEDNGSLERVRGEVARELQRLRSDRPPAGRNSWPPARPGVSLRLIRPPAAAGMVVGGVGLPHRLVVFVEHDEHPNLGNLGPVLEYRRRNPGRLAIQIIARGTTAAARLLRLRLCGAQKLGLELEYLRRLAQGPMTRDRPTAEPVPLVERLDEAAEAHRCETGEPELEPAPGGARGLPDGAWLDGTAVGQGDLEAIGVRIVGLEAAQRPLDAVFSAAAPAEL